jgi:hypothetical protein
MFNSCFSERAAYNRLCRWIMLSTINLSNQRLTINPLSFRYRFLSYVGKWEFIKNVINGNIIMVKKYESVNEKRWKRILAQASKILMHNKFRFTRNLDYLDTRYQPLCGWYWQTDTGATYHFILLFLHETPFKIIYRRKRIAATFAARYPFRPLISFRSVTLEAAIDMYQLYTRGFQLYKRCTPVVQLGVRDTIAILLAVVHCASVTIDTSIYLFGILLPIFTIFHIYAVGWT